MPHVVMKLMKARPAEQRTKECVPVYDGPVEILEEEDSCFTSKEWSKFWGYVPNHDGSTANPAFRLIRKLVERGVLKKGPRHIWSKARPADTYFITNKKIYSEYFHSRNNCEYTVGVKYIDPNKFPTNMDRICR